MIEKLSLTVKMLLLTAVVSAGVWIFSDTIQSRTLGEIFHGMLSERLGKQAREQRLRFDNYVKTHHQAIRLFANTNNLHHYLENSSWKSDLTRIVFYSHTPPWLPRISIVRKFIQLRYILLLDADGNTQEVFHGSESLPTSDLLAPSKLLLNLSQNQAFMTTLGGFPFLVTSAPIKDSSGKTQAIIMLASPLDDEFLVSSQGMTQNINPVALLNESERSVLVSSHSDLIPAGTELNALEDEYLVTGEGFFDYGASDLIIKFVSFISTEEVRRLTEAVLNKERQQRFFGGIALFIAFGIIMYMITRRIQNLTQRVVDFSEDMKLQIPGVTTGDQLLILEERFKSLADEIKSETAELEHQAMHDHLTELPNRKMLIDCMQREILRGLRSNTTFTVMVMDLHRFKEVNDTLGHHIGDLVLQQAGERLLGLVRKSDLVARLGGDEFAVLLPDTSNDKISTIASKIVETFEEPFIVKDHSLNAGISIGVVEYPRHGAEVNVLLQRADIAMYLSKRDKSGYQIYDPEKDEYSRDRLALMSELRQAIEEETLELNYQPIIDIDTNLIVCSEALLRWQHESKGMIPPDHFIRLAEQTGLIKPLTTWVIDHALHQLAEWKAQGINICISINLSVLNLHDTQLPEQLAELLSKLNMPPSSIKFEITETDIMVDPIRARKVLEKLDEMGVMLSIDDFGTGYSSLVFLKQLPIDEIKIDKSFVMGILEDENDATIVRTTIDLAHNLGLNVVAEGVNKPEILAMLKSYGCDHAQGYHISMPVIPGNIASWEDHPLAIDEERPRLAGKRA